MSVCLSVLETGTGVHCISMIGRIYKKQYHPRILNYTVKLNTQTSTGHSPNLVYS